MQGIKPPLVQDGYRYRKQHMYQHEIIKMNRHINTFGRRLITTVLMTVVFILVLTFMSVSAFAGSDDDLTAGISYIKSLEDKDVADVEAQLKEVKAEKRAAAIESGDVDVWSLFDDAMIMGDSRVVGFWYFGYLDESRAPSEGGATILRISEWIEQAQYVNPTYFFLAFGLNDISIGIWETVDDYIAEYDAQIAQLQEAFPNSHIYVVSIIPATDPAFETSTLWYNIPEWNEALKAHFAESDTVHFIDITDTVSEYSEYYEVDGIHVQSPFYEHWAQALWAEVARVETE